MIVLFHALFLVTRYFYYVISTSVFSPLKQNEPKKKDFSCETYTVNRENSKVKSEADFGDNGIRFFPPVYVQRYLAVKAVLEDEQWKGKIRKVVDFGCAEFGFFPYLKQIEGLYEILTVDIDKHLLENYSFRVQPLNADYIDNSRQHPLTVRVIAGSIAERDPCLLGCDAVVCIELIEHLYPDTLEDTPFTIFGYIKPHVAVFTTPNSDFNVLFSNFTGFRHPDHKFEWNREQFECWANNIVSRYPEYDVCFRDIGPGPPGTEVVGSCSQMALFVRSELQIPVPKPVTEVEEDSPKYSLVRRVSFPFHEDKRTDEEKIREEAVYHIHYLTSYEQFHHNGKAEVPLAKLLPYVHKWTHSEPALQQILENTGWEMVEHEPGVTSVVCPLDNSDESELSQSDCQEPNQDCWDELSEEPWDSGRNMDDKDKEDWDDWDEQGSADSWQSRREERSSVQPTNPLLETEAQIASRDIDLACNLNLESGTHYCTLPKLETSADPDQDSFNHKQMLKRSLSSPSAASKVNCSIFPPFQSDMKWSTNSASHNKSIHLDSVSVDTQKLSVENSSQLLENSVLDIEQVELREHMVASGCLNPELDIDEVRNRKCKSVILPEQTSTILNSQKLVSQLGFERNAEDIQKCDLVPFVIGSIVVPNTGNEEQGLHFNNTQSTCDIGHESLDISKTEKLLECESLPGQDVTPVQDLPSDNSDVLVKNTLREVAVHSVLNVSSAMDSVERVRPMISGLVLKPWVQGAQSEQIEDNTCCGFPLDTSPQALYQSDGVAVRRDVPKPDLLLDRLTDSPMVDSCSLDEQNDKLADSGYPNSASAQDMDLDLTPEQVEEIFTENDVLTENSSLDNNNSDSLSVSSGESDGLDNDDRHFRPIFPHRNDVLFEAMNVENGDVANNNRDGEGNNAIAADPIAELPVPIFHRPREIDDEDLIPLLAAAADLDNDNDVVIPENVDPFPHWLLNLLRLANQGAGDMHQLLQPPEGAEAEEDDGSSEDDEDEEEDDEEEQEAEVPPAVDEGLGDEFNPDSSDSDVSRQGSDEGVDSDGEVLVLDLVQEVGPHGDMGGGGEPDIFRNAGL